MADCAGHCPTALRPRWTDHFPVEFTGAIFMHSVPILDLHLRTKTLTSAGAVLALEEDASLSTACYVGRTRFPLNILLAVVIFLGVIAAIVLPRLTQWKIAAESDLNAHSQPSHHIGSLNK